jgi:hypothetical protein
MYQAIVRLVAEKEEPKFGTPPPPSHTHALDFLMHEFEVNTRHFDNDTTAVMACLLHLIHGTGQGSHLGPPLQSIV